MAAKKKTATAKVVKKEKKKHENVDSGFKPNYTDIIDDVEKTFKLNASSLNKKGHTRIPTGLLMSDLIMGGGIPPGIWMTLYGMEQTAKSTHMMQMLKGALDAQIPNTMYFDYEGSTAGSPDYFENIFEGKRTIEDVFGIRDPETGEWAKTGPARLYTEDIAEVFFDSMGSFLRKIPDKTCVDGQWYFVYDDTKHNRKLVSDSYSKKMYSKFKQLYIPTLDSNPQALIMLDSYPAMLGEKMDVDEPGSGMAAKARMFAENVPKVGSKMKRKCVNIIGVNQLRLRPGFTMGNPEYEPNGETLKFVSAIRLRQSTCAVPHASGQFEEEKSIFGGKEKYRYIKMKAVKNKTSTPQLEGLFRLCIQNSEGLSTGFDKVYDTFQYLKLTGQATGTMKKLNITLPSFETKKPIDWLDFKGLISLNGKDLKEHCKDLKITSNPKIREQCLSQMKSGKGMKMYFDSLRKGAKDEGSDEGSDESSDD